MVLKIQAGQALYLQFLLEQNWHEQMIKEHEQIYLHQNWFLFLEMDGHMMKMNPAFINRIKYHKSVQAHVLCA